MKKKKKQKTETAMFYNIAFFIYSPYKSVTFTPEHIQTTNKQ